MATTDSGIDVFSNTTGQAILEEFQKQNTLLSLMTTGKKSDFDKDWDSVARAVRNGYAESLFAIGSTFTEPWKDTVANAEYDNPWRVNHFSDVELQDGSTVKGMWLQSVYAHPFGVQYSHQRAFYAAKDGLAAGTYYFLYDGQDWNNVKKGTYVSFALTKNVPAGGRLTGSFSAADQTSTWKIQSYAADGITLIETVVPTFTQTGTSLGTMAYNTRNGQLNSIQETTNGHNRWRDSALRQYLNSDKTKGNWWTAQDEWDIAPDQLTEKDGFLCGMDAEMLENILPVKTITYVNTVQDGTDASYDVTYDKVSLISLEQMYINPQHSGEGEAHDYWKAVNGTSTRWRQGRTYEILKHYAVENHSSAQSVRLRSAHRGGAYSTWYVDPAGGAHGNSAYLAHRFSPLVVIGKSR